MGTEEAHEQLEGESNSILQPTACLHTLQQGPR